MITVKKSKQAFDLRYLYRTYLPEWLRTANYHVLCALKILQPVKAPIDTFAEPPYKVGFDKYQSIFIHVPKCAGISVLSFFECVYPEHIPYQYFQEKDPERFDRYFKFAIVRNPWDRLVSAYTYLKRGGITDEDKAWSESILAQFPDFDAFVKGWITPENILTEIHFVPQHQFICNDSDEVMMDFVARFETLSTDLEQVKQRLDIQSGIRHLNYSKKRPYQDYYSPETVAIVSEVYKKDIELFGYQFE